MTKKISKYNLAGKQLCKRRLEGMYPAPNVALSWTVNTTTYKLEDTETVVKAQANGLLNIMVSSLVERQAVEPEGALGCEITIPKTDFYLREELELFEYPKLLSRYTSSGTQWLGSKLFLLAVSTMVFNINYIL